MNGRARVKKYTKTMNIRMSEETSSRLTTVCEELGMNEAVYGRRAIEVCLERGLIGKER